MNFSLALQGLLIGLAVAAPVGPMSLLTVRRTLDRGLSAGLVSGVGIACADATYGAIAAFGLTSLSDVLIDHQRVIRIAGEIIATRSKVGAFAAPAASTLLHAGLI